MIEKLAPRERQVFEALCARGESTAAELEASMPDAPGNSALRVMLSRLEKKGLVTHRAEGQAYVYAAAIPEKTVRQTALRHLVETLFNGSPVNAAAALIGMSEKVEPKELDRLEALIAKARAEQNP